MRFWFGTLPEHLRSHRAAHVRTTVPPIRRSGESIAAMNAAGDLLGPDRSRKGSERPLVLTAARRLLVAFDHKRSA